MLDTQNLTSSEKELMYRVHAARLALEYAEELIGDREYIKADTVLFRADLMVDSARDRVAVKLEQRSYTVTEV